MIVCCTHWRHIAVCVLDNALHDMHIPARAVCELHDRNIIGDAEEDCHDGD